MSFIEFLFTRKFFISLLIAGILSILCTFLPLAGLLGYEYSVFTAIVISYISVFLTSELLLESTDKNKSLSKDKIHSHISSLILLNMVLLAVPFLIGLVSSYIKKDCSIDSGIQFFLLIPAVSVFFATALGAFCTTFFGRRGFFAGSIILTIIICYSIVELYYQPHLFMFNTVFGYFPGPIYDRVIPVTQTLLVYRINTLIWALLLIVVVTIKENSSDRGPGLSHFLVLLTLLCLVGVSIFYSERFGFKYSRDYIRESVLGSTYETENFRIHYTPGTRAAEDIEIIAEDHEWRYNQLSGYLGVDPGVKINSYIYPDTDTRGRIIGAYRTTLANPIHKEIHLVYETFPHEILKHELVHVLSSEFGTEFLKISPRVGLIEGLAVAADWPENGISTHQWAKLLSNRAEKIDLENMMGLNFWFQPSLSSYTLMGSFCRYLIDEYGIEKFKKFYKTGDTGVYGMPLEELSGGWQKFLDKLPGIKYAKEITSYRFSEEGITREYCPRKKEEFRLKALDSMDEGDYRGAVDYLLSAHRISANDPDIETLLSYAYYYEGDYQGLTGLSGSDNEQRRVVDNIISNLRGNLIWDRTGYGNSLGIFNKLKGQPLPDDIQREIEIKTGLSGYDDELRSMYIEFLKTNKRTHRIVILQEISSKYGFFAPAYYQLGNIFFEMGDYKRAAEYTRRAEARGIQGSSVKLHNLEILGLSLYAMNDYDESIKAFRRLIATTEKENEKLRAEEYISRVEWAAGNSSYLNK